MNSIKKLFMGLKGRLLMSAFIPLIGFIAISGVAFKGLNDVGSMLEDSHTNYIPKIRYMNQMNTHRSSVGYFFWGAMYNLNNAEERAEFLKKAKEALTNFEKAQDEYEKLTMIEVEAKNYESIRAQKETFRGQAREIIALMEKLTAEDDKKAMAMMHNGPWHKAAINIRKTMEANISEYQKIIDSDLVRQAEERKFARNFIILSAVLAALLTFGILGWIAYRVSHQVSTYTQTINESGVQVAGAIEQLSSAGQSLSHASTAAAASLEETVASLEEMTSMIKMNSDNAKQAAALSVSSRDSAEEGEKEIQSLIASMRDISDSSKKIEEIINVIDDIAFQTNLLALNAAVEAARAGEQGKGFAVVAEAVRALAQRSASAAKDITGLIKDSVDKIDRGVHIADKSGSVLNNIVTSVKKVSDLNNEIAMASSEQTTGIGQISKAMNQLDQSAQSNAASSEEIASTTEEISTQTVQMQQMVEKLQGIVSGEASFDASTEPKTMAKVISFDAAKKMSNKFKLTKSNPVEHSPSSPKSESVKSAPPKPVVSSAPKAAKKAAPAPMANKVTDIASAKPAPVSKASAKASSADVIPFDDDDHGEKRGKLGTTDGF